MATEFHPGESHTESMYTAVNSKPQVSVIIPSYNAVNTILETVESVLAQSYSNFELLIVDDGSTDQTLEIVESINDPRIRVFKYVNAGVQGPAAGRNRGLAHARGKLIAFLDHDDVWLPEKLQCQVEALVDNPDAAVAYCWVDMIDTNGKIIGPGTHVIVDGNAFDALLRGCFPLTGSNPLIRRSTLDQLGLFDEEIGYCDDWDMWLRISESYEFTCIPRPLVLWRKYQENTSSDTGTMAICGQAVLERAFARNPTMDKSQREIAIIALYESVIASSGWGNPTRAQTRVTLNYALAAFRMKPNLLISIWRKPWLLRALAKATLIQIFGENSTRSMLEEVRGLIRR